ncbi:hypothetical protein BGZ83_010365 [Gryganskiella cystojenkinii]|nr:hypothetical protein BGZ83_010365 [Gryganskiella cystojenkinii]
MTPSWLSILFFIVAFSSEKLVRGQATEISKDDFEVYSSAPALTVNPTAKFAAAVGTPLLTTLAKGKTGAIVSELDALLSTKTITPSASESSLGSESSTVAYSATKKQLEEVLGYALDVKFKLEVLSDEDKGTSKNTKVLGEIPVHLKVHQLTIGGVLVPTMASSVVNEQMGPLNYGNIHF